MRTLSLLAVSVVIAGLATPAYAQHAETPFGSLFDPARTPDGSTTIDDITTAVAQTAQIGSHASYMYKWDSGQQGMQFVQALTTLFRAQGLKVFLQFAPTTVGQPDVPDGLPPSLFDPAVQDRYLSDVSQLAALHPDYLNLWAEIDLHLALAPADQSAVLALYRQAYTRVKAISPDTQVGASFHFDLFFGLQLFWLPGYLGPHDYVAFTTYPEWTVQYGYVASVAELPSGYYDRVRDVFPTDPIIFSEIGWPSAGPGTVDQQAAFVSRLPTLFKRTQPVLATWTTLSDTHYFQLSLLTDDQRRTLERLHVDPQQLFDQFNSMGLVDWSGAPKSSFTAAQRLIF